MRILGIDPGYDRCGWAVLELNGRLEKLVAADTIQTSSKQLPLSRLQGLWLELKNICCQYQPDHLAVEKLYFSRNVSTALPVSEVRGLIWSVAFEYQIPAAEYTPSEIKLAVTGYGRADKKQVITMVQKLLKLETFPKIDDTSDAIAVALTHSSNLPKTTIKQSRMSK